MICVGRWLHKYLTVFLTQIPWGELDYLVIDLPARHRDAQLSSQADPRRSRRRHRHTPQDVSLIDARKGLENVPRCAVPVLRHRREHELTSPAPTASATRSFGTARQEARQEAGVPFLGEIPIEPRSPSAATPATR